MNELLLLLVISSANLVFGVPPVASGNIDKSLFRIEHLFVVFQKKIVYLEFFAIVSTATDCCFSYGFGAFAKPCCLKNITCEEHDKLVEENKVNPIAGGSYGKHKVCPKDAEEAHRLASGLFPISLNQRNCCYRKFFLPKTHTFETFRNCIAC